MQWGCLWEIWLIKVTAINIKKLGSNKVKIRKGVSAITFSRSIWELWRLDDTYTTPSGKVTTLVRPSIMCWEERTQKRSMVSFPKRETPLFSGWLLLSRRLLNMAMEEEEDANEDTNTTTTTDAATDGGYQ